MMARGLRLYSVPTIMAKTSPRLSGSGASTQVKKSASSRIVYWARLLSHEVSPMPMSWTTVFNFILQPLVIMHSKCTVCSLPVSLTSQTRLPIY